MTREKNQYFFAIILDFTVVFTLNTNTVTQQNTCPLTYKNGNAWHFSKESHMSSYIIMPISSVIGYRNTQLGIDHMDTTFFGTLVHTTKMVNEYLCMCPAVDLSQSESICAGQKGIGTTE